MPHSLKSLLIAATCIFICFAGNSVVKVSYDYDASGNRISRNVVLSRSSAPQNQSTDVSEMLNELKITYSPNPTQGIVNVTVSGLNSESGFARLFDMSGILLVEYPLSETMTFDLSSFRPGVYLLNVSNGDAMKVVRIIKE